MTRKIKLEFVAQPGYETLVPRTDGRWGAFQNTYAVWNSNRSVVESITIRRKIELQQGYYYVVGTVDNGGSVTVNGTACSMYSFAASISRTELTTSTRVYHGGGLMDIIINASNAGDVAGVAVTISEELSTASVSTSGSNYNPTVLVRSIGDLVWSTRTAGTTNTGRYLFTMPYAATIEAHVWGAGGAGGAGYNGTSQVSGGNGSPGLYNTTTFAVAAGDIVEVFVGLAGKASTVLQGGPSDGANATGGSAGESRTSVGGVSAQSYNGGRGGQGGRLAMNYSGPGGLWTKAGGGTGGGGGGGASGILVNDSPAIIAGGGGGGGGSGAVGDSQNNGTQGTGDSNASITKNATGDTPGDNRGENGRDVGIYNFGGGGGGGGGGYPGGQGGMSRAENDSLGFHYGINPQGGTGFHGKCGGNYPIYPPSTGAGTLYYDARYGQGGAGGRGASYEFGQPVPAELGKSGTDGRVVLLIGPTGLSSVKISGQWRQITQAFVKVGGAWKTVSAAFVNSKSGWKPLTGGGGAAPTTAVDTTNYGVVPRNYS